jgi:hypothetical protein
LSQTAASQWAHCNHPFPDRLFRTDVLGPDPFKPLGRNIPVPDAVRIYGKPRAPRADPKTGCLGSHHLQTALADPVLHSGPELFPLFGRTALGAYAKKQMALSSRYPSLFDAAENLFGMHPFTFSRDGGLAQQIKQTELFKPEFSRAPAETLAERHRPEVPSELRGSIFSGCLALSGESLQTGAA